MQITSALQKKCSGTFVVSHHNTLTFLINEHTRINEYGGEDFFHLLHEKWEYGVKSSHLLHEKLKVWWKKTSKKAKRVCLFIREFRVSWVCLFQLSDANLLICQQIQSWWKSEIDFISYKRYHKKNNYNSSTF